MKIKRYFAPDMRQAIRKVRDEQGPDAVILSNRRINGGIEIIAALDYDESLFGELVPAPRAEQRPCDEAAEPARPASAPRVEWSQDPTLVAMEQEIRTLRSILENQLSHLAWADLARRNPVHAGLLQRLAALGINADIAQQIAAQVADTDGLDHAWRMALGVMAHRIRISDDDILSSGGLVSVVGPTGVGKTTMVAKLAARYALRNGKRHVALVSTDHFRIGAYEQLHTYGQLLGVPVYSAATPEELQSTLADLADKHLVLIDTAGMSQRDMRLSEQLARLEVAHQGIRAYLVLSANTQLATLNEVVRTFRRVRLHGCLISKLDEAASLGDTLSAVIGNDLAVAYVGDGQRVPEDLHPARAHALVSRAVAMAQQGARHHGANDDRIAAHAHV